jgi:UDP-N-acetylglucosamine 2-epimerase (non-hydrolysing)
LGEAVRDKLPANLLLVEPLGYLEFNYLVKNAAAVLTDSGGVTEETTVMRIPCLTLRDSTERPETVSVGTNKLIGTDPYRIRAAMNQVLNGNWKQGAIPENWDGKAGRRIVRILATLMVPESRQRPLETPAIPISGFQSHRPIAPDLA